MAIKIAVLPGDGIGKEVTNWGVEVIKKIGSINSWLYQRLLRNWL